MLFKKYIPLFFLLLATLSARPQTPTHTRTDVLLNTHWRTIASDTTLFTLPNFEKDIFNDTHWKTVTIPHNWDDYDGYRRLRHGNRHGTAWYRKTFTIKHPEPASPAEGHRRRVEGRYFLFFEGVGSYATIWLNGHKAGYHAGGRTTFTLDITDYIYTNGRPNLLAVQADHPANINDLPWVCGGCSNERGFSEGSQPMGIFRPVHLITTNALRIEPFGVHIWNDSTASPTQATLYLETELKNYTSLDANITINSRLLNSQGITIASIKTNTILRPGQPNSVPQQLPLVQQPHLWSPDDPYLYTLVSEIIQNGRTIDRVTTPYGIRTIRWPIGQNAGGPFLINNKPFFINGIAEYEHLPGASHAFTDEQVHARVSMIKAAGFNAFRDAHQPHNLRYQAYWDKEGLLWWPQLSAHVWYDTPAFKENFLQLLRDWIKERRNSPSLVLWGLQNESKLPAGFAAECTALIRQMDPTASSQRKITTCNGGEGTDWDVPQNWTGTYGGNPATYAADLQKQILVGEYGGWRTLDLHRNDTPAQSTLRSEDQLCQLMETKIRLSDSVKDKVAGHFFWLLTSHDNPGRVQGGEGWRELDRIGPVNYKGLFTPWEEPTDVFYLFRSNFVSAAKDPMVYIVSHTNPDRWITAVQHDSIIIYSNCDEVELFNDIDSISLGKQKKHGTGTHFQWNDVPVRYNVLYAKGYVNGRLAARDTVLLNHLPPAPHIISLGLRPKRRFNLRSRTAKTPLSMEPAALNYPKPGYHYIYRVNCGGDTYTDDNGNDWLADRPLSDTGTWGSTSWANRFPGLPPFFASQRRTHDIIQGTRDWQLFQSFRYGRQELTYTFPLADGDYRVELYFIEPWINWPGGVGERLFDVAINDTTVLHNLDIYKEAGHNRALKKVVNAHITCGKLVISFPHTATGQALISAIAIASLKNSLPAPTSSSLFKDEGDAGYIIHDWMDTGDEVFENYYTSFSSLPPALFGAGWLQCPNDIAFTIHRIAHVALNRDAQVYIGVDTQQHEIPRGMEGFSDTKTYIQTDENGCRLYRVYTKRLAGGTDFWLGDYSMYDSGIIFAATPVSAIEPAYDLKPVTGYKAINAAASAGIIKETVNGKPAMVFKQASGDTLQWNIHTGVADTYSLTIRYANASPQTLSARLQLLDESGHLLHEETVQLPPSPTGKWSYLNSSTGTTINAGSYRLRLISINAAGLAIDGLDVQ